MKLDRFYDKTAIGPGADCRVFYRFNSKAVVRHEGQTHENDFTGNASPDYDG